MNAKRGLEGGGGRRRQVSDGETRYPPVGLKKSDGRVRRKISNGKAGVVSPDISKKRQGEGGALKEEEHNLSTKTNLRSAGRKNIEPMNCVRKQRSLKQNQSHADEKGSQHRLRGVVIDMGSGGSGLEGNCVNTEGICGERNNHDQRFCHIKPSGQTE